MRTLLLRFLILSVSAAFLTACSAPAGGKPRPALFDGDRVTVDRDFIYIDDPVFLQSKSVYGQRDPRFFSFQLPIFFNANRRDSLRFGPGGVAVTVAAKSSSQDSIPSGSGERISCLVDTGALLTDPTDIGKRFLDSNRTLSLAPGRGVTAKVDLNIYCRGYDPPLGRTDTLSLFFQKKTGAEGFKDVAFSLPFHVSYRGPVVSVLLGLGLLYLFTQLGWLIADS